MTAKQKTYTAKLAKAKGDGAIRAVFATLNVVDSDGDVTLAGAFGEQEVRMQPYGHNTGQPTIGKGRIYEDGDKAIFEGKINLAMASGKEVWESLKFDMANGEEPLTEFSYIYDIEEASQGVHAEGQDVQFLKALKVHSVDPVFLGAGQDTGLLQVKAVKTTDGANHDPVHTHPEADPPPKDTDPPSFADQATKAEASLTDVAAFLEQTEALVASLSEQGETLTDAKRAVLSGLCAAAKAVTDRLEALTKSEAAEPPQDDPRPSIRFRLHEADQGLRDLGID